jgi:GDPmannose 4,6-dehydratase
MKRATITGITGQGGSHLARHLIAKGYSVVGGCRRMDAADLWRLEALGLRDHPSLQLMEYDAIDPNAAVKLIEASRPDEIYHLAAQAHVGRSFETPYATAMITGLGTLHMLEAMRRVAPEAKFLQASSSELFGNTRISPQSETTPFKPRSPYGAAKLYAYSLTVNYAEAYGLFASNVILFNHESPLRSSEYVTRKITSSVAAFVVDGRGPLRLGNLSAQRDWGSAREYVDGMWRILQAPSPDAFVLATGRTESVRRLVEMAFATQAIDLEWDGAGSQERAICRKTGREVVCVDEAFYRPSEVDLLIGDAGKAAAELQWVPQVSLETIVEEMVAGDLHRARAVPLRL